MNHPDLEINQSTTPEERQLVGKSWKRMAKKEWEAEHLQVAELCPIFLETSVWEGGLQNFCPRDLWDSFAVWTLDKTLRSYCFIFWGKDALEKLEKLLNALRDDFPGK